MPSAPEVNVPAPEIRFFRDRRGHNVAYARHGNGPFVICPAWWVSHVEQDWTHPAFRSFFTRLGEGLTLVRYDRPGVGLSDRDVPARSQADEVDLLDDLVAELDATTYGFFATSCGAPVALTHAARHPDRVDRICLYGAYAEGRAICTAEVQNAILATVKAHWGLGSRAMADVFLPDASRELIDAFARYQRDSASVDVAVQLLALTYAMDARDVLGQVAAETLILHRRGDRAIPYESARTLAAGIKGARLVTLEGRTHPAWVDGDEIARMANNFLRGLDAEAAETPGAVTDVCQLDRDNRCLIAEGERIELTPLQFAVLVELTAAEQQVVTRDVLLEKVWKQPFEGSNRIDSLIRGLRRKLGPYAPSIETVIGHGYRFTGWTKR